MMRQGFHRADRAWYAEACGHRAPIFSVGLYDSEGGTAGEFTIRQVSGIGLRLEVFGDAWHLLTLQFADLLAFMGSRRERLTADELQEWMTSNGIEDMTAYEREGA